MPERKAERKADGNSAAMPDNVIVVLLDSLNRHMLGAYGGTSSTPQTSTASPPGRCASSATSPVRCRACRHATTFWSARWISSGGRGGPSSCGKSPSPSRCGGRRHHHAGQRPSAPVRDWRRELSHRVPRLGLRARPRERSRGRRGPTRAGSGAGATRVPGRARHYDVSRTHFREELDFPGPRTMSRAAAGSRECRRPRPLPAVRRRVRPPRAVRHAGALGQPIRPRLGR
jgi:hypothetical protein